MVYMTALGMLCLVVCLTLLASSFLPSHLSLKHVDVLYHVVPADSTTLALSQAALTFIHDIVHASGSL